MTYVEAIQYFTGRAQRWPDGSIIVLIVLPQDHMTTRTFVFEHLGMTTSQFFESLKINSTTRRNNTINYVSSERELIQTISKTPGSLGFVNNMMIAHNNYDFKIIRIW